MLRHWNRILVLIVLVSLAACQGQNSGVIEVREAWARPATAGSTSAVYFTIDNQSGSADTLLSAECSLAQMTELHLSSMDENGTMSMMHQENVPIPAGETVSFKPGGLHIMLMDLKTNLEPGQMIKVTLTFENQGQVDLEVPVREQ